MPCSAQPGFGTRDCGDLRTLRPSSRPSQIQVGLVASGPASTAAATAWPTGDIAVPPECTRRLRTCGGGPNGCDRLILRFDARSVVCHREDDEAALTPAPNTHPAARLGSGLDGILNEVRDDLVELFGHHVLRSADSTGQNYVADGWGVRVEGGRDVAYQHTGDEDWLGHSSVVWFTPTGDAIIVLSNSEYVGGTAWASIVARAIRASLLAHAD